MAFFATFILLSGLLVTTSSGQLYSHFIRPNFTTSYFQFLDQDGAFLLSPNATFKASISNPNKQLSDFYFSVIHSSSNTIMWTANRNTPISESSKLLLTLNGLLITDNLDRVLWSTPNLHSPVAFMSLDDSGNLLLLDQGNVSLWESFDYPTDTLVMGQRLPVGVDLSVAGYHLLLTSVDAVLQWNGMTYWQLSMDDRAFKDSNAAVSFMAVNGSGLYWFGEDGSRVVFQVTLTSSVGSEFIFAKLGSDGKFTISSYDGSKLVQKFQFPTEDCGLPSICGRIGFCSSSICSCPPAFHNGIDGCLPINPIYTLPTPCNASNGGQTNYQDSYLIIGDYIGYFSIDFVQPFCRGVNLSYCQLLCSQNCSCLGLLHTNSSGSCYPIQNNVGSIFSSTYGQEDFSGYIKTMIVTSNVNPSAETNNTGPKFSVAGLVLLSSSGFFLLIAVVVGLVWWRRRKWRSRTAVVKLGSKNSSLAESEIISIPGLPVRFEYEELAAATDNFKIQIGSGGFATVYKGILPNGSSVAVKKITNLGVEGKQDFCTEITVIGSIHHVNLVKLKGFCFQGKQRFLVYEYMNRGSLDNAIFNDESVLEWKERLEIAVGTARGLAYLHSECQHKIIHCDVKPENILLHDNLRVKISDFGISKLLTPEQSNLLTRLRGTRGYLAPERLTSYGISDKSDVYSYGMVLLEIVRGRRNFIIQKRSNSSSCASPGLELERIYFPLLALEMHEQKRYLELADPRLEGRAKNEEVEMLVRVALCCVQLEPRLRPTMSNVVGMLEGSLPLGQPRIESLNFLRFYGQRYAEAVTASTDGWNGPSEFIVEHLPSNNC
ncbi:hypothetical protein REPUB_Repub16aG0035700 [Reevesia pubescens]